MEAIKCEGVTKIFESKAAGKKTALLDVTFSLEAGGIYALLGRNGAGKTTLLNCLCTKFLPDQGEICLFGEPAYENEKMLSRICFMSDNMEAFSWHSVKRIINYAKMFYPDWDDALMEELMDEYEISMKDRYADMSKGRRTALGMVIGLCSRRDIVLFDEIYSGLDVVARQWFYEILMEQQEKCARTYVLSTHLIEEMEGLFTGVVILEEGRILVAEDADRVREKSYRLRGREGQERLFAGKNLVTATSMGTVAEYVLYDDLSREEREAYQARGFDISQLPLQDLVIAMTKGGRPHA